MSSKRHKSIVMGAVALSPDNDDNQTTHPQGDQAEQPAGSAHLSRDLSTAGHARDAIAFSSSPANRGSSQSLSSLRSALVIRSQSSEQKSATSADTTLMRHHGKNAKDKHIATKRVTWSTDLHETSDLPKESFSAREPPRPVDSKKLSATTAEKNATVATAATAPSNQLDVLVQAAIATAAANNPQEPTVAQEFDHLAITPKEDLARDLESARKAAAANLDHDLDANRGFSSALGAANSTIMLPAMQAQLPRRYPSRNSSRVIIDFDEVISKELI
jgi:hypothetical protein